MAVELFRTRAAADILGVSEKALRSRCRRGTLSCQKVGGRWRVALDTSDLPPFARKKPARTK